MEERPSRCRVNREPYPVPRWEHNHQNVCLNDHAFCIRVQSRKYDIPYQHKNPNVGLDNSGYTSYTWSRLSINEHENNGKTTLTKKNQGISNEEIGVRGTQVGTDDLQYVDVIDGDYTSLARLSLKSTDHEPVIKDMATIEEVGATERKGEAVGLTDIDITDLKDRPHHS